MSNPVLSSESFERAAGDFGIQVEQFARAVSTFEGSVNRLQAILGMQAENDQCKAVGASMAYTEEDFASV